MIRILKGNIFATPPDCYIAHSISGDFSLGAGLAKEIDKKYCMRYQLFDNFPYDAGKNYGYVGKALLIDNIFNLVTKPKFRHKVRMDDLKHALEDMKEQCEDKEILNVVMPKIGTGHDHLPWDDVYDIIESVFGSSRVDIDIYEL
jgi:hypothetical protein